MDPNETLKTLRETAERAISHEGDDFEAYEAREAMCDLTEGIIALDNWIKNGGFLPKDWTPEAAPKEEARPWWPPKER